MIHERLRSCCCAALRRAFAISGVVTNEIYADFFSSFMAERYNH